MRSKQLVCFTIAGLIFAGCSKQEDTEVSAPAEAAAAPQNAAPAPAAAAEPGIERIPGENAVKAALAAKEYNTAVSKLLAMKNGLPNEMWEIYAELYGEVRNTLAEDAQNNPQAAEALVMLRAATAGR
jgi:hypothetical protein